MTVAKPTTLALSGERKGFAQRVHFQLCRYQKTRFSGNHVNCRILVSTRAADSCFHGKSQAICYLRCSSRELVTGSAVAVTRRLEGGGAQEALGKQRLHDPAFGPKQSPRGEETDEGPPVASPSTGNVSDSPRLA